jgi:hypothetical protein
MVTGFAVERSSIAIIISFLPGIIFNRFSIEDDSACGMMSNMTSHFVTQARDKVWGKRGDVISLRSKRAEIAAVVLI